MSVKGHTHLEISTFLSQNVEGLQYVDKDKGQLEDLSNHVFPRPAVFISFGRFEYTSTGTKVKVGKGIIRFRAAVENYADSYTGSINQQQALAFFEFNEKVHQALEGLSGTYFTNLTKVADEDDADHRNVIVTILEYECNLADDSADAKKSFVLADPELFIEHKKNLSKQVSISDTFVI